MPSDIAWESQQMLPIKVKRTCYQLFSQYENISSFTKELYYDIRRVLVLTISRHPHSRKRHVLTYLAQKRRLNALS